MKKEQGQYQLVWKRFVEGDDQALSIIYFDFFDLLLNFGVKYCADRFLVEDAIQNLFVDLLKNRKKLNKVENIKFYLLKALRNQVLNESRKTKNLFPTGELEAIDFKIEYSIEKNVIANENNAQVNQFVEVVLGKLTDRQKEALYFKFNCGFDYKQISELMEISIESVRTMVYRTLKILKETFSNSIPQDLIFIFSFVR